MKFLYLAFLFCFSPILQVNAKIPKSITFTRTKYREEYIPGTKLNPGYIKSYEIAFLIPFGSQYQVEKIDENDCSEVSVIGVLIGAGIALSSSRGKDRFWAVPAGGRNTNWMSGGWWLID